MNYKFLKEETYNLVTNGEIDKSVFNSYIAFEDDYFILNHNINAVADIIKFLKNQQNIFILNGFMGAGKTKIADFIMNFIDENVLVFKNSYQEAINLDDVLLNLFKDFSIYHNQKKFILPKVESAIFSDKINAYIKYCDMPMLFIFDSFEINMRSKDTQKDILGFINYLSHYEKVKIIICSRTFRKEHMPDGNDIFNVSLSSLTKEEVVDYLNINNINGSNYETEEFYKTIRGHYLLLELSVMIMNLLDMSLTTYSTEYKKSSKNFLEFIISKILSVTAEKYTGVILLLSTIRHGVSAEFLINRMICTYEDIEFLLNKHVIAEKFGKYYVKDYVKNEYINIVNAETKLRTHKYLIELYENELPLKPFDRELFLSRQTMRQEISYHTKKAENINNELERSIKQNANLMQGVNYLSYSKTSGYDEETMKRPKRYIKSIKKTYDNRARFELSNEDSLLLNRVSAKEDNLTQSLQQIVNSSEKNQYDTEQVDEISDNIKIPDSLDDYIEIAQEYEKAYNYSSAILYYKKALSYNEDKLYSVKEPILYTKLAICYKKVQDAETAILMYEKAYDIYKTEYPEKANRILLSIAQIYNELYKFDNAKEVYKRILYSGNITPETEIKVYLDIAEVDDNNLDTISALENVKKALTLAEKLNDIKLLSQCYFKYALFLDDSGKTDFALKYYLRCIQLSKDPDVNNYLAAAYSNLAEISYDSGNYNSSKMYYELAVETDKYLNNYEGLYYSYSKLAELYKNEDSEKTYEYLIKALSSAKHFDDITYVVSVYIEIGDYYLEKQDYKRALKSYILARNLAPANSDDDIVSRITIKINKIKTLTGDVEYIRLINEIKRKH